MLTPPPPYADDNTLFIYQQGVATRRVEVSPRRKNFPQKCCGYCTFLGGRRGHDGKVTRRETVANPEALRTDIMLRLTNQSTEMERPSFDRLFVRSGLFRSPPYCWHRMGDLLIVWYPNLSPSSQSSRCLHLSFFFFSLQALSISFK